MMYVQEERLRHRQGTEGSSGFLCELARQIVYLHLPCSKAGCDAIWLSRMVPVCDMDILNQLFTKFVLAKCQEAPIRMTPEAEDLLLIHCADRQCSIASRYILAFGVYLVSHDCLL